MPTPACQFWLPVNLSCLTQYPSSFLHVFHNFNCCLSFIRFSFTFHFSYTCMLYTQYILTTVLAHSPQEILPKTAFWSLSYYYKELNLTTKPFTVRTLHGLLIQMQNIRLRCSGMRRKQNFEIFTFLLLFCFSFLIFFLLLGIQQASFWWEKFLGKLLGSQDQMKGKVGGQWNKSFMEIFRSMLHVFLPFSLVSLTKLCSFWYGLKDLLNLQQLADKVVLDR